MNEEVKKTKKVIIEESYDEMHEEFDRVMYKILKKDPVGMMDCLSLNLLKPDNPIFGWLRNAIDNHFDRLVRANINVTLLADKLMKCNHGTRRLLARNIDKFTKAGAKINSTRFAISLMSKKETICLVSEHISGFIKAKAKIDPTEFALSLAMSGELFNVAYNLDEFLEAGAKLNLQEIAKSLLNNETGLDHELELECIAKHLSYYLKAGANINPSTLIDELVALNAPTIVEKYEDNFIAAGVDKNKVAFATEMIYNPNTLSGKS